MAGKKAKYITAEGYRERLQVIQFTMVGPYRMVVCRDQHMRQYEIPAYRTSIATESERKDHPDYV